MPDLKPPQAEASNATRSGHPSVEPPPFADPATVTWLALVALTLFSAAVSIHGAHLPARLTAALAIAAICALKGHLLVRGYLRSRDAGPVFDRVVRLFAALAPTLLAGSALFEVWRAMAR